MFFFFQAEDGIRDLVRSRGLGDVYKRQQLFWAGKMSFLTEATIGELVKLREEGKVRAVGTLSLIHI